MNHFTLCVGLKGGDNSEAEIEPTFILTETSESVGGKLITDPFIYFPGDFFFIFQMEFTGEKNIR